VQTLEAREIESQLEVLDVVIQVVAVRFVVLRDVESASLHGLWWHDEGTVFFIGVEGLIHVVDDFFD
jgi:hypothetical protein